MAVENTKKKTQVRKAAIGTKVAINDNENKDEEWGVPARGYGNAWDLGTGKNPMAPRLPKGFKKKIQS